MSASGGEALSWNILDSEMSTNDMRQQSKSITTMDSILYYG